MSDLTNLEKRKFEQLLAMGDGYVLNFSNRTFSQFVIDSTGRNPYDARYDHGSSKANRLRGFWRQEGNGVVAKLMGDMLDHGVESELFTGKDALLEACRRIVARLLQASPVAEADALAAISDDRDFDTVAKAVKEAIEKNEPESGLDRLHTFVIKYVRMLCTQHGLTAARDKPLHSLFGEYVKRLRDSGHVESEMAARILKSSISTLEAFNDVRNNRSLAHDNPILHYDEALLIFNHVASSIRFLRSVESRIQRRSQQVTFTDDLLEDIPF
jgi:hypothetical protein